MGFLKLVVLNEKIKKSNYATQEMEGEFQINSIILLKFCNYKSMRSSVNNGTPYHVNMTTPIMDNVYGSDFDNFSPETMNTQLNQQGVISQTDGNSGNSGFSDPSSTGQVITYGSF